MEPQHLAQYQTDGFVHLPDLIPAATLERIGTFLDTLLVPEEHPHRLIMPSPSGPVATNIDKLLNWGDPALLELFTLPRLMEGVAAICGDDFFPVQEFAVIKHRGDGMPVLWHQDMPNRRSGAACTVGIYLDPSFAGDGALRPVPGSHREDTAIEALVQSPSIEVTVEAGDAIEHDMLTAHSSSPMAEGLIRRVIYLEFLSADLALKENIYPPDFIARRRRLMFAARRYHAEHFPGEACYQPPFAHPQPSDGDHPLIEVLADIHDTAVRSRAANYLLEPL